MKLTGFRSSVCCLLLFTVFAAAPGQGLTDKKATAKTNNLYGNLRKLSQESVLFGHQEDDAYGVGWRRQEGRSDVKDVCGSYPAVHGWDIGNEGQAANVDSVRFEDIHRYIRGVYRRGGVNTISWHMDNPVTGADSWNKTPVVKDILPGGTGHAAYLRQLDIAARFLKRCRSGFTKIPIIFRPFHEHNGDWFWWGQGNCTEDEYIRLWRFTVDYLKNKKGLHHIIYAFSPDRSRLNLDSAQTSYLYAYPGDDYVDVIGLDNYMDVGVTWNQKPVAEQTADLVKILRAISRLAEEKNKIAALTETGQESIANTTWFTEVILHPLKQNPDINLAYFMVWRNANKKHHYAPYPGHPAVADFLLFYKDSYSLFESDLNDIYKSQ